MSEKYWIVRLRCVDRRPSDSGQFIEERTRYAETPEDAIARVASESAASLVLGATVRERDDD